MGKLYMGFRRLGPTDTAGRREFDKPKVRVTDEDGQQHRLNAHRELLDHAGNGLDWGNRSPGAFQLAFALAYAVTGDVLRAKYVHQELLWRVVFMLPFVSWTLSEVYLRQVIADIENKDNVGELDEWHGDE